MACAPLQSSRPAERGEGEGRGAPTFYRGCCRRKSKSRALSDQCAGGTAKCLGHLPLLRRTQRGFAARSERGAGTCERQRATSPKHMIPADPAPSPASRRVPPEPSRPPASPSCRAALVGSSRARPVHARASRARPVPSGRPSDTGRPSWPSTWTPRWCRCAGTSPVARDPIQGPFARPRPRPRPRHRPRPRSPPSRAGAAEPHTGSFQGSQRRGLAAPFR
jgi:hypothetical protein